MYKVLSAYKPLKKVLMHRPGPEIELITPDNERNFNFSPVNAERFRQDYDTFLNLLAQNGAEPVLIGEVLKADTEAMAYINRRPNVMYTRDISIMAGTGIILLNLALKGRKFDEWVVQRAAARLGIPVLGRIEPPGILEGGGLQFFDEHTLLAGLCDRANESAIHQLRDILFTQTPVDRLIMIMMPEGAIHIDGQFLMIDEKLAIAQKTSLQVYPSILFEKSKPDRPIWFTDFLEQNKVELIEISWGEGQKCAANYIITAPRQGVGYDFNPRIDNEIRKRGGKITTFPGQELIKGHGGPHCMTCPLWRE
jgi:arginine deiminase